MLTAVLLPLQSPSPASGSSSLRVAASFSRRCADHLSLSDFTKLSAKLAYGADSAPFLEDRVRPLLSPTAISASADVYGPARLPPYADSHHSVHLWHRRAPHRRRLLCPPLPWREGHLPSRSDLGQPHPHRQGLGSRGQDLLVLRQEDRRARLRGHEEGHRRSSLLPPFLRRPDD